MQRIISRDADTEQNMMTWLLFSGCLCYNAPLKEGFSPMDVGANSYMTMSI